MVKNVAWGSTGINSRAIAIQYFSLPLLYFIKGTDIANYVDDTTPYNANLMQYLVLN